MYGQFITMTLLEAHDPSSLLAPILMTPNIIAAQDVLIEMLNSLPSDSLVLQFILENLTRPLEVIMDKITEIDSSLRSSINLGSKLTKNKLNFNGGVYLLSALSDASQYVGSTQNHFARLASHIYNFNYDYAGLALDLSNKYH